MYCWDVIPRWSALNRMGRSRLLRTAYFWLFAVPMLARLLYKVGPEVEIPLWSTTITLNLSLPFSWKLLFYSSVGFALGSFAYSMRCPAIIRDYDRFSDFVEQGKGGTQITKMFMLLLLRRPIGVPLDHVRWGVEWFGRKFAPLADFSDATLQKYSVGNWVQMVDGITLVDTDQSDAFWFVRDYADRWNPVPRIVCAMAYATGFFFALWVAWQNFWYVWRL